MMDKLDSRQIVNFEKALNAIKETRMNSGVDLKEADQWPEDVIEKMRGQALAPSAINLIKSKEDKTLKEETIEQCLMRHLSN